MNFFSFNFPLHEYFFGTSPPAPPPHKFSNGPSLSGLNLEKMEGLETRKTVDDNKVSAWSWCPSSGGLTVTNFCTHINTVKSEFTDTHLIWTPHTCTVHTSCELVSAYVRYSRRTLWTILWPITDLEKSKDRIRLINVTMAVRTLGHRK